MNELFRNIYLNDTSVKFKMDFEKYLSCYLATIVVPTNGRTDGERGRKRQTQDNDNIHPALGPMG